MSLIQVKGSIEMEEMLEKILISSGYTKVNTARSHSHGAYLNGVTKDCMIVAEYSAEDLANFESSATTSAVMDIFQEAERQTGFYKETSLLIACKLESYAGYEDIKNTILSVEENPYAFRKYVVPYTDTGLAVLNQKANILEFCAAAITDVDGFRNFEKGEPEEYYRLILDLYVKLPFLNVRGVPELSLSEFDNPALKNENQSVARASQAIARLKSSSELNPDLDLQISKLFEERDVLAFLGDSSQ